MWNRIRKLKKSSNTVHRVSVSDWEVTSHHVIANALADNFSHNSSAFGTDAFAFVCKKADKQTLNLSSDNAECTTGPIEGFLCDLCICRVRDT